MSWDEGIFREKLGKLNSSQQAIEGLSGWCIFHKAEARRVAEVWEDYFSRADQGKRLAMVYLANDILQNSRKKGPEFLTEFFKVLPRALRHMLAKADDRTRASVHKVVRVWDERRVFGSSGSKALQQLLAETQAALSPGGAQLVQSPASGAAPAGAPSPGAAAPAPAPVAAALSGPLAQLDATLAAAAAAAQRAAALQGAVAAAAPQALSPAATAQQVGAARQAAQALFDALQQELVGRQAATAQLRRLLQEQEQRAEATGAAAAACRQQLDALAQRAAAQPVAAAPQPAAPPQQQQQQQPEQQADAAAEAAALAAALAQSQNTEALLQALMALPKEQQDGLGADLAGLIQPNPLAGANGGGGAAAGGGLEGGAEEAAAVGEGDDLYDPEDF